MIVKETSGFVYINGTVPAVGQAIKPYDVIDARLGKLIAEDGTSFENISARLVDLGLATIEEVIADVKPVENPTATKPEVPATSTDKTK